MMAGVQEARMVSQIFALHGDAKIVSLVGPYRLQIPAIYRGLQGCDRLGLGRAQGRKT